MKNTIGFKRHLRPERLNKKRATFGSTFRPFQSVELSLLRLLLSRAAVRFTQLNKNKLTTDTVRYTLPDKQPAEYIHAIRSHSKATLVYI